MLFKEKKTLMEKWIEILTAQRNPNYTLSDVSFCYIRFNNGGGFVPSRRASSRRCKDPLRGGGFSILGNKGASSAEGADCYVTAAPHVGRELHKRFSVWGLSKYRDARQLQSVSESHWVL